MPKLRKILLICLVLTALGTIVLPMQIERPLFFFKTSHVNDQMFAQPLVNMRQAFSQEEIRFAKQKTIAAKRIQQSNLMQQKIEMIEHLPSAWVIKVAEVASKTAAVEKVSELQAKGLPAFYQQHLEQYYIMIGPEINLAAVKQWHTQVAKAEPEAVIKKYQPAIG